MKNHEAIGKWMEVKERELKAFQTKIQTIPDRGLQTAVVEMNARIEDINSRIATLETLEQNAEFKESPAYETFFGENVFGEKI